MKNKKRYILCVDDEKMVLDGLKRELEAIFKNAYHFEFAQSAAEALEIVEELLEEQEEIALVVSDHIMPNMQGDELLIRLHKILPKTKKIMLTGQAGLKAVCNVINNAELYRYIAKPWEKEDFALTLKEALKSYENEILLCAHQQHLEESVKQKTKDLQEALIKLEVLVNTDELTGIYNRRYFYESGTKKIFAHENSANEYYVCMLDLDRFKRINDTFGHEMGDRVIKAFCHKVKSLCEEEDVFARQGGEEFVLLTQKQNAEAVLSFCEMIRNEIENLELQCNDAPCGFTVSIGISRKLSEDIKIDTIISRADKALYKAKKTRNSVKIYY